MNFLNKLIDLILHFGPDRLNGFITDMGVGKLYVAIFVIVFAETGFVVTPFLPGDSLLFALGVIAGPAGSSVSVPLVIGLLVLAALCGDNVNYWIGRGIGPKVFSSERSRLLNKKHLLRAQAFYENYGGKTIILARFVPIVRTFAPFVAGIGKMSYVRFLSYSVAGAIAWVSICVLSGYALSSVLSKTPFLKDHFELVILAIVAVSVMPMVFEYLRARKEAKHRAASQQPATVPEE